MTHEEIQANIGALVMSRGPKQKLLPCSKPHGPYRLLRLTKGGLAELDESANKTAHRYVAPRLLDLVEEPASCCSDDSIFGRIYSWRLPALREMALRMLAELDECEVERELMEIGDLEIRLEEEEWGHGFPPYFHVTLADRKSGMVLEQGHGATKRGAMINALCDWRWKNSSPNSQDTEPT